MPLALQFAGKKTRFVHTLSIRLSNGRSTLRKTLLIATKRALDLAAALVLSILLLPLFVFLAVLIKTTSKGPVIHWSNRIGQDNRIFRMPKLRSMRSIHPR